MDKNGAIIIYLKPDKESTDSYIKIINPEKEVDKYLKGVKEGEKNETL